MANSQWGWVLAGVFFVLMVVRDAVRDALQRLSSAAIGAVERRFAGSRRVRVRAIRRYRRRVAERLAAVPVPFQLPVEIPMASVYIPLRAADGTAPDTPVDLADAVADRTRTLVLGPPGSGKSLFVRHVHWSTCSRLSATSAGPLTVYVPLNRLGESADIEDAIVAALDREDFTGAGDLVRRELRAEDPHLLLLFDGLDEVGSETRAQVTKRLAEFAWDRPAVRFVVTCRSEVYTGALDGTVDRVLHVEPFTDELVRRFLYSWPNMTSRQAVDRLLNALRDTPRVAGLVRNPLLVTMLAYLYSFEYDEQTGMLPRNRTQFYREATELLLSKWQEHTNRFKWVDKKVVLQHLALVNQSSGSDRRGMSYEVVLAHTKAVLPRVNLPPDKASDVIDEIVERSGLLTRLDGGERYQFAHQTLQEYFAAVELHDKPDVLIARYREDPVAWEESVKLWCGGDYDSTPVLEAVAGHDLSAALECLADATEVDDDYAHRLAQSVWQTFTIVEPSAVSTMASAFGTLASDQSPVGRVTFDLLAKLAKTAQLQERAIEALAASNLPEGAEAIARCTVDGETPPYVLTALESMGNLAVPALGVLAGRGNLDAISSLTTIGTPEAAQELVPLLWIAGWNPRAPARALGVRAALHLAQLLRSPEVETAVAAKAAEIGHVLDRTPSGVAWVWEPFRGAHAPAEDDHLAGIFGRCRLGLRLAKADDIATITRPVDGRLSTAAFFFTYDRQTKSRSSLSEAFGSQPVDGWLRRLPYSLEDQHIMAILSAAEPRFVARLGECIAAAGRWPTFDDWQGINTPLRRLDRGRRRVRAVGLLVAVVAIVCAVVLGTDLHVAWRAGSIARLTAIGSLVAGAAAVAFSPWAQRRQRFDLQWTLHSYDDYFRLPSPVAPKDILATSDFEAMRKRTKVAVVLAYVLSYGYLPALAYGLVNLFGQFGVWWAVGITAVLFVAGRFVVAAALRAEERHANPLARAFQGRT